MRRVLLWCLMPCLLLLVLGCASRAVYVRPAPPAARVEIVGAAPFVGAVWVPGHWEWHGQWLWSPGHWAKAPAGKVWVAGYWQQTPRGWRWVNGHWARR
ncbi:MAG: YXWGXW repeat-containing protein [Candidatus Oleimicrobiaceae bacterium]